MSTEKKFYPKKGVREDESFKNFVCSVTSKGNPIELTSRVD